MRRSIAAFALIRRDDKGRTLWLAQWNRGWQRYNFVGGHREPGESYRQCVIREVSEELGLEEKTEFSAASESTAHLEYTAWSEGAREETEYALELFEVELLGETVLQKVDSDPHNCWLTMAEIQEKKSMDGKPVSETMGRILAAIGEQVTR